MESNKKLMVGLFVGGTLFLFALGLFLIGNATQLFTKSFTVYAEFSKVPGLQVGSKVRVAGMDAGAVTVIEVPPKPKGKFRVQFRIVEKLHPIVRQDSVATIQTDGLLGNKFLEVDAGTEDAARARNWSSIESKEPFDWSDLMDQMSETVASVNTILVGVKDQVIVALGKITDTAQSADQLIKTATPDVKAILDSANKIAANIHTISDGIREGRGTMGALFNDKGLADNFKRTVVDTQKTVENIKDTTGRAKSIVGKMDDGNIVPELQQTVKNLQQITRQVKDAVDKYQSASGEGGVSETLQKTLADAHEAMSDLSDDTEALKHNFLFRGYFKKRGFFDLGSITLPEYKAESFGKRFKRYRVFLESGNVFIADAKGVEAISASGKLSLDAAMAEILAFPRNGPLMVEGFASGGTAAQQYLQSRRRAALVQGYITNRFHLHAAFVGIVAMGSVAPEASGTGAVLDGVGLVSFYKK